MADDGAAPGRRSTAVDRAVRLFEFLARSRQLKSNPPRTTDSYDSVLWLGQLPQPQHPAVRSAHREDAPEPDADLLTIAEPAHEVTIVIVTHNMQQAARVSQQCAFFLAEQGTPGVIVEAGPTKTIFDAPSDSRTSDYVHGRFG